MNSAVIEPVYHNAQRWEDWQNHMFRTVSKGGDENLLLESQSLLIDQSRLYNAMARVISEWVIATEERLTKLDTNRRAWLGWAACSINHGAPDFITRKAWAILTDDQRNAANLIAEKLIFEWESNYAERKAECIQLSLWQ